MPDDLRDIAWQIANEVDSLPDEDRERLWPLVNRLAKIANVEAEVVQLRILKGGGHVD